MRAFGQPGDGALVHLHNVSGGVLAGDRLSLDVEIEAGAIAQITTTGATRLYRHREGARDSEQCARFRVGDGAILEYLPDAMIPYAESRHVQRTEIRLGREATLFWWEVVAPGRLASGERFAFDRLRMQNDVYAGTRAILLENYLLEPRRKDLTAMARMSDYSYSASLCIARPGKPTAFWRELEDKLNEIAHRRTRLGQAIWGASTLAADGIIVRGLSMSGCYLHATLVEFWIRARPIVTGREATLPRKIY